MPSRFEWNKFEGNRFEWNRFEENNDWFGLKAAIVTPADGSQRFWVDEIDAS